jgi:hypothetical protein
LKKNLGLDLGVKVLAMQPDELLEQYLGALINPMEFIDKVKRVTSDVNAIQREKERIIEEILDPTPSYMGE